MKPDIRLIINASKGVNAQRDFAIILQGKGKQHHVCNLCIKYIIYSMCVTKCSNNHIVYDNSCLLVDWEKNDCGKISKDKIHSAT